MKFCDKLAKQRKNNNLSQEQLADKLNVSRQAVSKWESASSYPDMEKIIQMTKILNCTLEDLLDDGTIKGNNQEPTKINLNNCLKDLLSIITKTYNMFCSMTLKEKLGCILEMSIIAFILFIISCMGDLLLIEFILDWLLQIPKVGQVLWNILNNLIIIIFIVISFIIFIHLFKIRYLDYYITIEDSNINNKTIEEPIDSKEYKYQNKQKEKIIIRDPKHSTMSLYNFCMKIVLYILKFFAILLILPTVITWIFLLILGVISLYHTIYAIIFMFIALAFIGAMLICYTIFNFLYHFIFNQKINFKRIFLILVVSFLTIGISIGIVFINLLNYNYKDNYDDLPFQESIKYINITQNTIILDNEYLNNINNQYIIDNSIETGKAKVEIKTIKGLNYELESYQTENYIHYYLYPTDIQFIKLYKIFIKDLKAETIRSYSEEKMVNTKIYISEESLNILKSNNNINEMIAN